VHHNADSVETPTRPIRVSTSAVPEVAVDAVADALRDRLPGFCRRWRVRELSLLGSALGEGFGPESDVDVMVSFEPDAPWDALDLVDMRDELAGMVGREVDLVEKEAVRNPFLRREMLARRRVLYVA
jgi:hypothetical protein